MKTNDLLNQLSQNISDSYDVVEAGGGAMPSDRITWNLANAVRTIPTPTPTGNPYGKLTYYSDSYINWAVNKTTRCTAELTDQQKYKKMLVDYEITGSAPSFTYTVSTDLWRVGLKQIGNMDTFLAISGISVDSISGSSCTVSMTRETHVNTDSPQVQITLETIEDFYALGQNSAIANPVTLVNGLEIPNEAITAFEFGSDCGDSIPDYFLIRCDNLVSIDTSALSNVTVGTYFLAYATSFNQALNMNFASSIGTFFLRGCSTFNSLITLPNSLSAITNDFLRDCSSFNQPIAIPDSVVSIGTYFLSGCTAFAQDLILPANLETIGTYFLNGATAFNSDLIIPQTLTSFGSDFMFNCTSMVSNVDFGRLSPNDVTLPSSRTNFVLSTNKAEAAMYEEGVQIKGEHKEEWMSTFPNRTSSPYRNLIAAINPVAAPGTLRLTDGTVIPIESSDLASFSGPGGSASWPITVGDKTFYNTEIESMNLSSVNAPTIPERFLSRCSALQSFVLPNNVSSIGKYFLNGCTVFNYPIVFPNPGVFVGNTFMCACSTFNRPIDLTNVALASFSTENMNGFLTSCESFNNRITFPSGITHMPGGFLQEDTSFNKPLELPDTITSGFYLFLTGCTSFNQDLHLPQNVQSISNNFMSRCDAMTKTVYIGELQASILPDTEFLRGNIFATNNSSAAVYTSGLKLSGTYASDWKALLPDSDARPYRKVILV